MEIWLDEGDVIAARISERMTGDDGSAVEWEFSVRTTLREDEAETALVDHRGELADYAAPAKYRLVQSLIRGLNDIREEHLASRGQIEEDWEGPSSDEQGGSAE